MYAVVGIRRASSALVMKAVEGCLALERVANN